MWVFFFFFFFATINKSHLNIHNFFFLNDTNYILDTSFYKIFIVKFIVVLQFSFLEFKPNGVFSI